ncbi:MAG: Rrf2 family transcriptional regulator [Aeromicrobium erythreum]
MATPTNTQFSVAAHVMTYLAAADGRAVGATELAASANVNPVHVRKVLGPLRDAGLLASTAGRSGGWRLACDPRTTTLADVWAVVQGDDPVLGLHGPSPDCPVGRQVAADLGAVERRVAAAVRDELARTTVADLGSAVPVG